jgi:hypothetical protein
LTITAPVPATPVIIVERDDGMFAVGWHDAAGPFPTRLFAEAVALAGREASS